jgi:hypothetical protein
MIRAMKRSPAPAVVALCLSACGGLVAPSETGVWGGFDADRHDAAPDVTAGDDAAPPADAGTDSSVSPDSQPPGDARSVDVTRDAGAPIPDFAWYRLDETSGTTAHDSTQNHYDVMDINGVTWSAGAHFDSAAGVCGWTSVPTVWRQPPVTLSAWITSEARADSTISSAGLTPFPSNAVSGDIPYLGGYGIGINVWTDGDAGSGLGVERGVSASGFVGFTTVGSFVADTEYFLAVTETATTATVYLGGALMTSFEADVPADGTPTLLYLGCHNQDTGYDSKRFFNGRLRDVRVYKRVLSAAEVERLNADGPAP